MNEHPILFSGPMVQDITPAACKAEGIFIPHPVTPTTIEEGLHHLGEYKSAYQELWDSINGSRGSEDDPTAFSWERNPWVWVIEFKPCTPPEMRLKK